MRLPQSRASQYGILAAAVFLTRFAFRSRLLYDLDSVNFATGMERFDVTVSQPHAPGYYLYIVLARLFSTVLSDANDALVAVSILFSCLGVIAMHRLTEELYDRQAAMAAGAVFVFSPLYWFHGTVALVYIVEAFFAALIGWLCWETYSGKRDRSAASSIALGVCLGFRQSACLFLGPLWLFSLRKKSWAAIARSVALCGVVCFAWFIPMAMESGGAMAYLRGLYDLWTTVAARETTFAQPDAVGGVWLAVGRAITIAAIFVLTLGFFIAGSLTHFLTTRRGGDDKGSSSGRSAFFAVWMAPGLLFFTFVFMRFVNSGYLLVITPPAFAWVGHRMAMYYRTKASPIRRFTPFLLAGLNTALFLFAPLYCSRQEVVRFEQDFTESVRRIRDKYDPDKTLLVGIDSHFHGFRHAGYYLPEFETLAYPGATVGGEPRILATRGRDSRMALPPFDSSYETVVFFPMPKQDLFDIYLRNVDAAAPSIERDFTSDRLSLTGPIDAVAELYPAAFGTPSAANSYTDVPR